MKAKHLIGVTGGIGAGKTTFCQIVEVLGYPVFYSDKEAKEIVLRPDIKNQIIALLGEQAFENGCYNIAFVKGKVFAQHDVLLALNAIVHPAVKESFRRWFSAQCSSLCFYESALLYQSSLDSFDKIIEVVSPTAERIARVLKRDANRSEDEIRVIISKQQFDIENEKIIRLENKDSEFFLKKVIKTLEFLLDFEK